MFDECLYQSNERLTNDERLMLPLCTRPIVFVFPNLFFSKYIYRTTSALLRESCYVVADLLCGSRQLYGLATDLLATRRGSLRQVSDLLWGSYGETGVVDFGFNWRSVATHLETRQIFHRLGLRLGLQCLGLGLGLDGWCLDKTLDKTLCNTEIKLTVDLSRYCIQNVNDNNTKCKQNSRHLPFPVSRVQPTVDWHDLVAAQDLERSKLAPVLNTIRIKMVENHKLTAEWTCTMTTLKK